MNASTNVLSRSMFRNTRHCDAPERCRDRPLPPPSAPRARVHAERMGLAVVAALLAGGTLVVAATSAAVLAPGSCLEGVAFPLPGPDGPAAVDSGSAPR